MKKVLFGTTALVAAGMIGTAAQAAEPIKLSVGGMMYQWMLIGDVDSFSNGTSGTREYGNVALQSDTEVFFSGSTVLDNGLKVAVRIELEAERTQASTGRNADQQFVTLSGGWGQVRVGEMFNAATIVHNQAPTAGANMGDVINNLTSGATSFGVPNGATMTTLANGQTTVDGIANAGRGSMAIDYISPMFGPFAFGLTYTPNVTSRGFAQEGNSLNDLMGAAFVYADKWGPVGIKADVAYARFDHDANTAATGIVQTGGASGVVQAVPVGLVLSYAGFDVGGSYIRIMDSMKSGQGAAAAANGLGLDGHAWDAGVAYTTGPWKFGYTYYTSSLQGGAGTSQQKDDKMHVHNGGGQYTMGPGVVVTANIAYQKLQEENTDTAGNKQEAIVLLTGLKLSF